MKMKMKTKSKGDNLIPRFALQSEQMFENFSFRDSKCKSNKDIGSITCVKKRKISFILNILGGKRWIIKRKWKGRGRQYTDITFKYKYVKQKHFVLSNHAEESHYFSLKLARLFLRSKTRFYRSRHSAKRSFSNAVSVLLVRCGGAFCRIGRL